MPLIILEDEGKKLGKRQAKVPDKLVDKIKANLSLFGKYSQSKGYKRANSIVNKDYNKRSNKKDKVHNNDKTLSFADIKKIDHEYKDMSINDNDANANNLGYILPGGNDMKNWAHDTLRKMRTAVKKVDAVPQVPKLEKDNVPQLKPDKDIKMGSASVKLTESYDDDYHIFYDYIEEYDAYYVLDEFFNEAQSKQDWGVLINPEMYIKALREFSRFGKLTNSSFPSKYVYQWMGIIMKNTAILGANTDLAGHSMSFPGDIVAEFAKKIDGITIGEDYNDGSKWLYKKGLYDWMQMPDGSDAWSDYGLSPLWDIINEYNEDLPPEDVLVLVNKALDVAHCRGDLASIFIQGGSKVLTKISEEINHNSKKIKLTENQLLLLKEYHGQTVFNFDNEGNAYFEKNNWENYVDFLEEIGSPGTLPPSEWGETDISAAIEEAKENIDYNTDDVEQGDRENAFIELAVDTFIYERYEKEDIYETYFLELFWDYEQFKENNNYYDEGDTLKAFLDTKIDLSDEDNLDEYLTSYGIKEFQDKINDEFKTHISDYDIENGLTINERGLIYIERNIKIPKFNSPNFNYNGKKNYYTYLKDFYSDLGYYFSWEEGSGEAYCGSGFGYEGSSEIKLKCWIDPKDVNWQETVYKNCYSLREEKELYVSNSGSKIEVFDVVLEYGEINGQNVSGKSLIKTPIIITY